MAAPTVARVVPGLTTPALRATPPGMGILLLRNTRERWCEAPYEDRVRGCMNATTPTADVSFFLRWSF